MKYFDISPRIDARTPVFPGDQEFERKTTLAFAQGDNLGLSWIKTTLHIGAHADAPSHYHNEGVGIDNRDLGYYLGSCQVIDATHVGARRILPGDIDLAKVHTRRVLFQTHSFRHDQAFQMSFTSLSHEIIQDLSERGVILIGIDTPSVDPSDSKDLPSHAALYKNDMAVLEGIDLDQVKAGDYRLIALPLRLNGADASPVRAVLIPMHEDWD